MAVKVRTHREWFRAVSLGNRKTCPSCKARLGTGESIYSWGEYHNGKWHTVRHFCRECWPQLASDIVAHVAGCGCVVELVAYRGEHLPEWLQLPMVDNCTYKA